MSTKRDTIVDVDRRHVWHPYTATETWEKADPIVVARASGAWLEDVDGRRYIDGNSSWWVAGLGHSHPRLVKKLAEQAAELAHVTLAGTAHEHAALLAQELAGITGLEHAFYTDNGSGSIEVAIKVALQHWKNVGQPNKTRFVALDGAYHGDTLGPTSLGGVEVFRRPYASVLFECVRVPFPDPKAHERAFEAIRQLLRTEGDSIAAVIVEPIVQGAAGMRIYDPAFLKELREETKRANVLLVTDEVFAGYGRTGPMWAGEHAGITPDMMCLGKVFSSILPMAATMVSDEVFRSFRGGPETTLWYGHTFCGHPLGAALAREVLAIYREEDVLGQIARKGKRIADFFGKMKGVENARAIGMIGAAELGGTGYLGGLGWKVFEEAKKRGAYLRPLGDTIYVCPPFVIPDADLERLLGILEESVEAARKSV